MNGKNEDQGERLKRLIRQEGHTYKSLGEEIGITEQAVGHIVHGKTTGATARYAFAKALGREVDELWPQGEAAA